MAVLHYLASNAGDGARWLQIARDIRDVSGRTLAPNDATLGALKSQGLVTHAGPFLNSPVSLTDAGRAAHIDASCYICKRKAERRAARAAAAEAR